MGSLGSFFRFGMPQMGCRKSGFLMDSCLLKPLRKFWPLAGVRRLTTSYNKFNSNPGTTISKSFDSVFRFFFKQKSTLKFNGCSNMRYFVIGVSGVTCGGKTTLTKLLQRKFPWALVIHQDHYFFDDDYPNHIRVPESENHVNYEIFPALDMEKMYKDVKVILDAPPQYNVPKLCETNASGDGMGDKAETPNFDDSFLQQIPDINDDVSKYKAVPILIIEGFTIFASQYLYDVCDARFFCSLDEETCRQRRSLRSYFPPDSPNYFDKVIWPEYQLHFDSHINRRAGVTVFDGSTLMADLWKSSIQIITCRIEEKYNSDNATNMKGISL